MGLQEAGALTSPSACQTACTGNTAEKCGGTLQNQLYELTGNFASPLCATSVGCYKAVAFGDALVVNPSVPHKLGDAGQYHIDSCALLANSRGHTVFGLIVSTVGCSDGSAGRVSGVCRQRQ